jgi:hypothetical protein
MQSPLMLSQVVHIVTTVLQYANLTLQNELYYFDWIVEASGSGLFGSTRSLKLPSPYGAFGRRGIVCLFHGITRAPAPRRVGCSSKHLRRS